MKIVIAAVNSKFVHMSLAPWYLKAACEDLCEIKVLELTINQDKPEILRCIYNEKPDIIAFSCYIFNISHILSVIQDLKKILPKAVIILGGPEVSYNAEDVLLRNSDVDYVVCSEGEERLKQLLTCIIRGESPDGIDGIAYREKGEVKYNPPINYIKDLDTIVSPYTDEMLKAAKNKIAYFESSRGCPFSCAYCLSGSSGGVRRFSLNRVKSDLERLMLSDARQIKFVDRTFNCNPSRAREIIKFILNMSKSYKSGKASQKNYHFEAAADLFDDETIELLSTAPAGLFQLEIGIQSFNEKALAASARKTNLERCKDNIKKLVSCGNMHIHLDLIAGLPYEDFKSFSQSFDKIYELSPHCIQLGFLKLLHGSALRNDASKYGYVFSEQPPYEVLSTPWLSYDDILVLKGVEAAVDVLYNTGRFFHSLTYIISKLESAFNFFLKFSQILQEFYPEGYGIPSRELYKMLLNFAKEFLPSDYNTINELLKFDFFISDSSCNPPKALERHSLPNARELYAAERSKGRVHFERFSVNPLEPSSKTQTDIKFDYTTKNPVTGHYGYTFI